MSEERTECSSSDSRELPGVRGCPVSEGEGGPEEGRSGLGRILRGVGRHLLDAFT